jgi:hypothetical protein
MNFTLDTSDIFSKITIEFRNEILDITPENFETKVEVAIGLIDKMYRDDDSDIEDFYDLIMVVNDITHDVIKFDRFSNDQVLSFIRDVRIYAKKQVKRKYRDHKYNGRKFWQSEDADTQYALGVEYIWKPSVKKVRDLCVRYRS